MQSCEKGILNRRFPLLAPVRASSVKRVASALGEGSIAIHLVHKALEER